MKKNFVIITDRVVFDIDDIPGSTKTWAANNPGGTPMVDGDYLTATVYYTNLPASNSGFGKKNARVKFDGVVDDTKCFWVFYPADAKNYPGAPPQDPDYPFIPPSNYFHYYMDSSAAKGSPGYDGYSQTMLNPPYNYFAAVDVYGRTGYTPYIPGVNGGNTLSYIDLFAWAARHEYSHHLNLDRFWGMSGINPTNDRDKWTPLSNPNGDCLPDDQELILVTEAGPYDPLWVHTHLDDEQPSDYERHNCNSINAEEWVKGSADTEDWAVPGNQWHP